jgi:hypothetical protein
MAFIISAKQQYSGKWSQKMIKRSAAVFTLIPLVSACAVTMTEPEAASPTRSIPEEVIAIAGPNQDIMSAFLRPDDNCFWHMHNGPVERTPLPLRTSDSRHICIQQPAET